MKLKIKYLIFVYLQEIVRIARGQCDRYDKIPIILISIKFVRNTTMKFGCNKTRVKIVMEFLLRYKRNIILRLDANYKIHILNVNSEAAI